MYKNNSIMKAEVIKMGRKKLLKKIEKNKIMPIDVYRKLYVKPKVEYASFCKINIFLNNESRNINLLMRTLFFFPMPIFMLQFALGFVRKRANDIDINEIRKIIVYMKGTSIVIQDANKEANINIKIY
jgi:hypothetical protein